MSAMVHTIFCDDIRQEINGKLLYIGVYRWEIIFESLPASATLLTTVCVSQPKREYFKDCTISVKFPDGSISKIQKNNEISEEKIKEIISNDDVEVIALYHVVPINHVFTSGRLIVDVEINGKVYRAGSLLVSSQAPK